MKRTVDVMLLWIYVLNNGLMLADHQTLVICTERVFAFRVCSKYVQLSILLTFW